MLRIFIVSLVLSLCVCVLCADYAHAQRKGDISVREAEEEKAEYEAMILKDYEYTDADFALMNNFYMRCMRDGTSMYYKCDCLANKYIQKKVVYDDTITDHQIYTETAPDCVDITAVAGLSYTECSKLGESDPRWSEEYCQCYANTFAIEFAKSGGTMSRAQTMNTRTDAMKECGFFRVDLKKDEEERKKLAAQLRAQARARLEQQGFQ